MSAKPEYRANHGDGSDPSQVAYLFIYSPFLTNDGAAHIGSAAALVDSLRGFELGDRFIEWNPWPAPSVDVPCGKARRDCDLWWVIDTRTGDELARIPMHHGAHNTIASLDGERIYLASAHYDAERADQGVHRRAPSRTLRRDRDRGDR